ncbi:hypothetical protein VTK73DRAFT_3500 [Phialemonium thermophilum]|uniref:F-box domain-containing protein n=1 Tax=Phialemonium thermophilum TaxID=223376 RepID=A0ABR3VHV3_9PEZI
MKLLLPTAAVLGLAALAMAKTSSSHRPPAPDLTYLCTVNLTTGPPISTGTVPDGARLVIPFVGGVFAGPRLNGTIAPVGADFSLTSESGDFKPDGTFVMQTSDGASIVFHDVGHAPYAHVAFETGFEKYRWLNTAVGIAVIAQTHDGASLAVFLACSFCVTNPVNNPLTSKRRDLRKMGLAELPTEILQQIILHTIPDGFEQMVLTCRLFYQAGGHFLPEYNRNRKRFRHFKYSRPADGATPIPEGLPERDAATDETGIRIQTTTQLLHAIAKDPPIARYIVSADLRRPDQLDRRRNVVGNLRFGTDTLHGADDLTSSCEAATQASTPTSSC